ncbi:hypothetical protein GGR58DRAFT_452999 [Xylaria digitata]|nr:hypothetical protein GGR58DRAFT_452999 [Xylaria digitata]
MENVAVVCLLLSVVESGGIFFGSLMSNEVSSRQAFANSSRPSRVVVVLSSRCSGVSYKWRSQLVLLTRAE